MTIKPLQADFMNYTYFFKGNMQKGLLAFYNMIWEDSQFNIFVNSPAALTAAFTNDANLKTMCEYVYSLGEEKRNMVADAYAKTFGYNSAIDVIWSPDVLEWRRNAIVWMLGFSLTKENLLLSLENGIVLSSWVGETVDIGTIKNQSNQNCDGICTIIGVNHDDKSDGSGKAMYSLLLEDGSLLKSGSTDRFMQMNSSNTNVGGWKSSLMRTNLNKFSLGDVELASFLATVNKTSHNDSGNANLSSVSVTSDKFWIPSSYEMFGETAASSSYPYYEMEGTPYQYLVDSNKIRYAANGNPQWYWLRTPSGGNTNSFRDVNASGSLGSPNANSSNGVPLGFCLG